MSPQIQQRLNNLLSQFAPQPEVLATLKLGDITYEVPASLTPSRLPHSRHLLNVNDQGNLDNLHYLLQKFLLGQDICIVSEPGPYARRLALTFAKLINKEYEYISLHRDVGETELKQGREIRSGGNLLYVDSPTVNAVKHGRLLILEGIEKAERGILPILNNLLENREINLDDGTHVIHPHKHGLLDKNQFEHGKVLIPAHKDFRVIGIVAPVPPYTGYPLDPPFRSRFQGRFIDPISAQLSLLSAPTSHASTTLYDRLRDLVLSIQIASESQSALEPISKTSLPPFPQTALAKLQNLVNTFPPPEALSPTQLGRLLLAIHPGLIHAPFQAWAILSRQTEAAGLGEVGSPSTTSSDESCGIFGYQIAEIRRCGKHAAQVVFNSPKGGHPVMLTVPAGPKELRHFPFVGTTEFNVTPRFLGLLTCFLQAHALGWDISVIPPALPATASTSTTTLIKVFGHVLGYETDVVHMYKELGGRELIMRRKVGDGGATSWEPSALIEGAWAGSLLHLAGLDVIGSTAGSLSRITQDRESELWAAKRIVGEASQDELEAGQLSVAHPSFRIVATASKSIPLKEWLTNEHANMFFHIPSQPMDTCEEAVILEATGCPLHFVDSLLLFAERYRNSISTDNVVKTRKLGTKTLVRLARKIALYPQNVDLFDMLQQALLAEFLPATEKISLDTLLADSGLIKGSPPFNPYPFVENVCLVFPAPSVSTADEQTNSNIAIPLFDPADDAEGTFSYIPHMDHFYENSLQTGLMKSIAIDLALLGEHVVLLGNQGVGKNKIVDRLCQLLKRPREYVQLHRDTTVNQLMFNTMLEGGLINYADSPLLRAIKFGRVIVIDEADKAPEHVVAIFRSLAGQGELSLSDGRRVRLTKEREDDIVVHRNFRLVLLANRPGYPFLGNHFLQVLGENFSTHSVSNPDRESEMALISQLAPGFDKDFISKLVGVFHDLRKAYEAGVLSYPYSLRELINLVKHMTAYPSDSLGDVLRNVFDFDINKPETLENLSEILTRHGLYVPHVGLEVVRESAKKVRDIVYEAQEGGMDEPKEGELDSDEEHSGGSTFAGGSGGSSTAGIGGRGGYKRMYKKSDINQVPDVHKRRLPDELKEKAREMAREELQRRLEQLDMSVTEARGYSSLLRATHGHMAALLDLLEHLAAKEEERVWVKRQTDGELDDTRLTEGLTGESTVYKRRGIEKPELGRPQVKPKRIKFIFDLSASMYRFQNDGRLQRSLETAVMLMETFDRLSRKDKYVWDMCGHSGDGPEIPLVMLDNPPVEIKQRWKVAEKMNLIPQYAFAGDYTVEAIAKGVTEVAKYDADDWFVITITDANFGRYGITQEDLLGAMKRNPKVNTALICIGEGAEATSITKALPGRAFRIANTSDIPNVLRSILSTMVDR